MMLKINKLYPNKSLKPTNVDVGGGMSVDLYRFVFQARGGSKNDFFYITEEGETLQRSHQVGMMWSLLTPQNDY